MFNEATKYVASRGRPTLEWSNSLLIEPDAAAGLAALKAEDGPELQVHGSSNLIQTLLRHNLIDEYRLWVFPVVIGSGKRLFADGAIPAGLRLVDSTVSTTGVVIGTLRAGRGDRHRIICGGVVATCCEQGDPLNPRALRWRFRRSAFTTGAGRTSPAPRSRPAGPPPRCTEGRCR